MVDLLTLLCIYKHVVHCERRTTLQYTIDSKIQNNEKYGTLALKKICHCVTLLMVNLTLILIICASFFKHCMVTFHYPFMPDSLTNENKEFQTSKESECANTPYIISPEDLEHYQQIHFDVRKLSLEYIDHLERSWEGKNNKIWWVSVLSTPLEYHSSPTFVSTRTSQQLTGGDYHAFIVLATTDGAFWSLDKNRSGIYIQSTSPSDRCVPPLIGSYFSTALRATPVTFLSQCSGF